jgi:hypothetical protein
MPMPAEEIDYLFLKSIRIVFQGGKIEPALADLKQALALGLANRADAEQVLALASKNPALCFYVFLSPFVKIHPVDISPPN